MGQSRQGYNTPGKHRLRTEIDRQVDEYLKKGGKIEVLAEQTRRENTAIGSVWRLTDDIPHLGT